MYSLVFKKVFWPGLLGKGGAEWDIIVGYLDTVLLQWRHTATD